MKKALVLLLALLMAFAVSGCAESLQQIEIPPFPVLSDPPQTQTPTAEPGPESPTPTQGGQSVDAEEIPTRILVNIGRTEKTDYDPAEGEKLILSFFYDMPRVYSEEIPEICTKINETLATVEETFYTGDSYGVEGSYLGYSAMLEAAEDNFTYVRENNAEGMPLEFTDTLSAWVKRADNKVLSVVYTENRYEGGPHGSYGSRAYNFDLATGELLTLDQLSEDTEALTAFLAERVQSLVEEDTEGAYAGRIAEDMLPEGGLSEALRGLLREGSWYFDNEGMVIFSNLEEFGPYAAGILEFRIPYADLDGRIKASWLFPGPRQGKGKLDARALSEVEGGETEIVDKLVLNEGGEDLCIIVSGRIYDVSICSVYYSDGFLDNTQFWYASTLSDCALQLQVIVPEGLPNLRITYTTADGERHGKLLSQSGLDGAYMLVDDDIQAVG